MFVLILGKRVLALAFKELSKKTTVDNLKTVVSLRWDSSEF